MLSVLQIFSFGISIIIILKFMTGGTLSDSTIFKVAVISLVVLYFITIGKIKIENVQQNNVTQNNVTNYSNEYIDMSESIQSESDISNSNDLQYFHHLNNTNNPIPHNYNDYSENIDMMSNIKNYKNDDMAGYFLLNN